MLNFTQELIKMNMYFSSLKFTDSRLRLSDTESIKTVSGEDGKIRESLRY